MPFDNLFLEETPLTSTKNKYIEGNVKYFEDRLREKCLGSFGDIILKKSSGAHLFTNFSKKNVLTSTEAKYLPQYDQPKKKKAKYVDAYILHENSKLLKRCSKMPATVDTMRYCHKKAIKKTRNLQSDLRNVVSALERTCSASYLCDQSDALMSELSQGETLADALMSEFSQTEALGNNAFSFTDAGFAPSGSNAFTFGASTSQARTLFGGANFLKMPMGFPPPAMPAIIPETVIMQMPSYQLDVLNIEDKMEIDNFTSDQMDSSLLHKRSMYNIRNRKLHFLNVVSMSLLYSSNLKDNTDAYRITLLDLADEVKEIDPEFILKVALYARQELHIRTVTNFLLSYAARHPSTRIYLEKYFGASIVLPLDWIQVAEYYEALRDETECHSLPAALRCVMKKAFSAFDEYQLAKYNRNKSKKKKAEKNEADDNSNETCGKEKTSHSKTFTLKNLIRTLHIISPVDHVMCLLGKKYPESAAAFQHSGLPGKWDPNRSGKRMKLPTPETWETQISSHGNKPTVWESLIDKNKLPYMAMLRNLKNLILSGISPKHHKQVVKQIENKKSVVNSRQLPMQFFEAYKALSDLENRLKGNESEKLDMKSIPAWKRGRIEKQKEKIKNVSASIVDQYKSAVSNALEISSLHNLNPIPGKTLVICEIPSQNVEIKTKAYETCLMMGLMCMKACEDCKMTVLSGSKSPNTINLKDSDSFLDVMMVNCRHFKEMRSKISASAEDPGTNVSTLKNILESYLKPQTILTVKLDHIVFLHCSSDILFHMKDVMSSFLLKYRQIVNPDLLYTDVNFSLSSTSFLETNLSEKDVYLCGSSSSLIKFIADRSSGGQLVSVENIDLKFNLHEISQLKKVGPEKIANLPNESVMPVINREPKWHTVRIFISSTFKDMLSERDLMIRYVFPELRHRAASIFVKIAEIDLRWGITEEDSSTEKAAELCLIEAEKSDLFVGFIGDRYGTIYDFEAPDAPSLQWVNNCPPELSITELEIYAAALRDVESSRKKAFFYFRNNSFLRHVPQKWASYFTSEDFDSKVKVDQLKDKIKSGGFKVFDGYPCHFAGIFENKPILAGLDVLGGEVLEDLWKSIEDIHKEEPFSDDGNEEELYQQNLINSLNFYAAKKNPIDSVIKKLQSENGTFVVCGDSGSGKTAFCIKLLQNISNYVIVKFFVGISPRSRDLSYMIQNICNSICIQLSVSISLPDIPEDIVNQFPDFLVEAAKYSGGRDVILLIDGLDHLEPNDQRLDWLPLFLPNNIKLVCSVSESSQAFKVLYERQVRGNNIFFDSILPLEQSDREFFIKNYLDYYRKALGDSAFSNHMLKVVTKKDSSNPLYLRILCDFFRLYGSFDTLVTMIQKTPSTITLLLQEIILQLENEFGTTLMQTTLSLLCISKLGIEDSDLHYVLSFIMELSNRKTNLSFDQLKEGIRSIEPENLLTPVKYCSLIHTIITFAYGQFRPSSFTLIDTEFECAVKKFYLNKNYDSYCKYLHSVLAAYYHSLCDLYGNEKFSGQSGFTIRALLYHMFEGNLYKELSDLLCNHQFVEAVFRTKADEQLLEYYSLLLFDVLEKNQKVNREISHNHLYAFYDFVSRNFHIFHQYPQLVMQQALNEPPDSLVKLSKYEIKRYSVENLSQSQFANCRLATLSGFVKNITASSGEMGKSFIFLGSEDGYLKVLDLSARKVLHSIKSHFSAITCICYAGKNRICVSSVDGTLSLWDSQDFSRVAVLKGHRHNVTSCCADPSGCILFSSAWDNSVRLWSLRDGRSISAIEDFKCPINCIAHHPIKQQIACGLWNGNIEIVDTISMEKKHVFQNSKGSVKSISYTPDGVSIISCFMQSEISILSSEEGLKMSSLKGHILPVKTLSFSYDNNIFISGSEDCTLKVWSLVSGTNYSSVDECKFCPISLMEFLSENLLALAFQNSEIWITDVTNGKPITKFNLAPDIVSSFSKYSPVNFESKENLPEKSLVLGTQCGKLLIGNLLSSSITIRHEMKSKITALLHNIDFILCGSADGDIGLFSYSEDLQFKILPGAHRGFITHFCLTARSEDLFALSSSYDNVLKLWSIAETSFEINLENEFHNKHKDSVTCSIFLQPSSHLYGSNLANSNFFTGSHDNNIILWNDTSEKMFQGLHSSVLNIACFNDYVLGCGNDGAVVIWSLNGNILSSIPGIELSSTTLTFHVSEDKANSFIVSLAYVDKDGSVKITKPLQRTFCYSLEGHMKPITTCCTAKTGEIISCSLDGSINLWRMPSDIKKNETFHSSAVTGIIISSCSKFAISSDAHGNVILWKTDLMSSTSHLVYCSKKSFIGGFVRGLSLLRNNRFVCAVTQTIDSEEKYFLTTLTLENCICAEGTTFSLQVKDSHYFENEISCLDSCAITDVIVVGLKSGEIIVITSDKQKHNTMCDDWLLGVSLLTRDKTSDLFCASFVDGHIKLFSIADFLDVEDELVRPFAVYEPSSCIYSKKLNNILCCGADRLICCGDLEGVLKIYSKHLLKFSEKVHGDSITGICIVGIYIFTCSLDRTVKVWNLSSFKQVCQFHSHVPISCLAAQKTNLSTADPSDNILLLGTSSGEVQLLKFHPN